MLAILDGGPRRRDLLGLREGPAIRQAAIVTALAFFSPPGSGNSSASTTTIDNRVGASDEAVVQQGGSVQASDEAVVVKDASTLHAPGSVSFENVSGGISVQGASEDLVKNALQSVEDISNTASAYAAEGQSQVAKILSGAISQVKDLAQSQQTQGESDRNRIILYIVLGIGVLIVLAFIFRNKKR